MQRPRRGWRGVGGGSCRGCILQERAGVLTISYWYTVKLEGKANL